MSKRPELTPYVAAEDLRDADAIRAFLNDALATNDAAYVAHALGVVARARGMAAVASETGSSREQLDRSLSSDGDPSLRTALAVLQAVGMRLAAVAS